MGAAKRAETTMTKTVEVTASKYADHDDCLSAAAEDYAVSHGLKGWDLSPRWADSDRERIALTVPCEIAPGETFAIGTPSSGPIASGIPAKKVAREIRKAHQLGLVTASLYVYRESDRRVVSEDTLEPKDDRLLGGTPAVMPPPY